MIFFPLLLLKAQIAAERKTWHLMKSRIRESETFEYNLTLFCVLFSLIPLSTIVSRALDMYVWIISMDSPAYTEDWCADAVLIPFSKICGSLKFLILDISLNQHNILWPLVNNEQSSNHTNLWLQLMWAWDYLFFSKPWEKGFLKRLPRCIP